MQFRSRSLKKFSRAWRSYGRWARGRYKVWRERVAPRSLGGRGEATAARYVRRQGFTIVARSDRSRLGEIDLIAVHERTVVFIEVKTRHAANEVSALLAVDNAKQRRLTRLAVAYLKRHNLLRCAARFDVVAVTFADQHVGPSIEHIPHAFAPTGFAGMFS